MAVQLSVALVPALCYILDLDVRLTIASFFTSVAVGLYCVWAQSVRTGGETAEYVVEKSMKREASKEVVAESRVLVAWREVVAGIGAANAPQKVCHTPKTPPAKKKVLLNNLTNFDGSLLKTPEGRPLAEPPAFNYEAFVRDELVPDKKLDVIFVDDPVLKTKFRDSQTQRALLDTYLDWSRLEAEGGQRHVLMRRFYRGLENEIFEDYRVARDEAHLIKRSLSPLIRWELEWLDDNGGVHKILPELEKGVDVLGLRDGKVFEKYGHLLKALPHYPQHDIQTWEHYQLGEDGKLMKEIPLAEKGVTSGKSLRSTINPEDEEYIDGRGCAHLSELLAAERVSVRITDIIRHKIQSGEAIFTTNYYGGEQAKKKYHVIASSYIRSQKWYDSTRFDDLDAKWPGDEGEDDCLITDNIDGYP